MKTSLNLQPPCDNRRSPENEKNSLGNTFPLMGVARAVRIQLGDYVFFFKIHTQHKFHGRNKPFVTMGSSVMSLNLATVF